MHGDLFPTERRHRLFFALRPDAQTSAAIGRVAAPLRVVHPRARWIEPARYHATLLYLGETAGPWPDRIDRACRAAGDLPAARFTLRFDRLDALGQPSRPALALTAPQPPDALRELHEALRRHCREHGIRIEAAAAGLLPHVTIAYTDPKPVLPTVDAVSWQPDAFELIHSIEGQPRYEVLGRWPLAPPSA